MPNQDDNKESVQDAIDVEQDFEELGKAGRKGLFGRLSSSFNEALQTGRGPERRRNPVAETADLPKASADDLAIRRAKNVNLAKMVIPEGVIIEGSLTGGSDTEVSGRVDGNVTVDGRVFLGASALVSGNVSAGSCHIDGLVEGKVECAEEVDLGKTGRLNAEVIAGKRISVSGQVYGNITTPGTLRLTAGSKVHGDIRARRLVVEEGAELFGRCSMRAPAQRTESK